MNSKTFFATILMIGCAVGAQQLESGNQQLTAISNLPNNITCKLVDVKPSAEIEKYSYHTCIVAEFAAYITFEGKYLRLSNGMINNNVTTCANLNASVPSDAVLSIMFPCATITFYIATKDNKVFVKDIAGQFQHDNQTQEFTNHTQLFITQSGHYYRCNSEQHVEFEKLNGNLTLSNFAFEAYRSASGSDFSQIVEECALDSGSVSDLVRIGVGVCLVALVAIVLIAYFVGRKKWAERSSYESV